jgi:DNA-binding response OmpR family regulator
MRVILLTTDLMVTSVAQGAARRHGMELQVVADGDAALTAANDGPARLIAIDVRTPGLQIDALAPALRSGGREAYIVAFGPHVHRELLAAAARAGCDEVITRGEFDRRIDALLGAVVG